MKKNCGKCDYYIYNKCHKTKPCLVTIVNNERQVERKQQELLDYEIHIQEK